MVKVVFSPDSGMVSIGCPYREPYQMWGKDEVLQLINDLYAAWVAWEEIDKAKARAK